MDNYNKKLMSRKERIRWEERNQYDDELFKYLNKIMCVLFAIVWVYAHFFMFRPFDVRYQKPKMFSSQQNDTIIMTYNGHSTDFPQAPNPPPQKSNATYTSAIAEFQINGQKWQCGCRLASNGESCTLGITNDKRTLWRGTQFDELHMIDIGNKKCFITKLVWQKEVYDLPKNIQNKLQYYIRNICDCGTKKTLLLILNAALIVVFFMYQILKEKEK